MMPLDDQVTEVQSLQSVSSISKWRRVPFAPTVECAAVKEATKWQTTLVTAVMTVMTVTTVLDTRCDVWMTRTTVRQRCLRVSGEGLNGTSGEGE